MNSFLALLLIGFLISAGLLALFRLRQAGPRGLVDFIVILAITLASGLIFVGISTAEVLARPWLDIPLASLLPLAAPIAGFLLGGGLGLLIFIVGRRLSAEEGRGTRFHAAAILVTAGLLILGLRAFPHSANPAPGDEITPSSAEASSYIERIQPSLPDGFTIEEVVPVRSLNLPTAMVVGREGELYVGTAAGIMVLRAEAEGGAYSGPEAFAPGIKNALGLEVDSQSVYAASEGSLYRLQDTDKDGLADVTETLVEGLPHFVYDLHSNNGLAFGPDGRLYMTLGATSDHDAEDHPLAGSILVMQPDGGRPEVFARGFRNPYDLAFCSDGRIFATDNGPDQLDDRRLIYTPPDEVNLVTEGGDYGHPEAYGYPPPWSPTLPPVALLPQHAAATGIICYEGGSLPDTYNGDLFLTLWRKKALIRVNLTIEDEHTVGEIIYVARGFENPIDVVVAPDGSLLVLDFLAGQIYRISYMS